MREFIGLVAIEGKPSEDGRIVDHGALVLRQGGGVIIRTAADELVGRITDLYRVDNLVYAKGFMDLRYYVAGDVLELDVSAAQLGGNDQNQLIILAGRVMGAKLGPGMWPGLSIVFTPEV